MPQDNAAKVVRLDIPGAVPWDDQPPYGDDPDLTLPPHSLQAEEAVLGSVLKNPAALAKVADSLHPGDFYSHRHRLIWAAMLKLHEDGKPVDYHMLADSLQRLGTYEQSGGLLYLSELNLATPSSAYIEHYAGVVIEKAQLRSSISLAQSLAERAYRQDRDSDEVLAEVEGQVATLRARQVYRIRQDTQALVAGYLANMQAVTQAARDTAGSKRQPIVGISCGISDLDRLWLGFRARRYCLLGARTGKGKTVLLLQWALYQAKHCGPVALYSLEMSPDQVLDRLLAMVAKVNRDDLTRGTLDDDELERVHAAGADIAALPLYMRFDCFTTDAIRGDVMRLHEQVGQLAAIYVDYVQLLADTKGGRNATRHEDLGMASRQLSKMAKLHDCPVIAAAQLSRDLDKRKGKGGVVVPKLSDFRDSGNLEQDADLVLALTRPEVHTDLAEDDEQEAVYDGTATIHKLKDRDSAGSTRKGNRVTLQWIEAGEFYGNSDHAARVAAGTKRKPRAPASPPRTDDLPWDAPVSQPVATTAPASPAPPSVAAAVADVPAIPPDQPAPADGALVF